MNVDDMTTKNDLISRSKLVSEIENAFQETGSNVDSLQSIIRSGTKVLHGH